MSVFHSYRPANLQAYKHSRERQNKAPTEPREAMRQLACCTCAYKPKYSIAFLRAA